MADIFNCDAKSDEELVQLTLQNQDYFVCLMQRYQLKLLNYVQRLSNISKEEAEDILQEVFLKTYRNINSFDPKYKFSTWVYRIAHNETISHFRKQHSNGKDQKMDIDDEIFERLAGDLDIERDIKSKELQEAVKKAINKLNKKYRQVIMLRFFEDKDYQEISFILKKPAGTVATWIKRAKDKLGRELSKEILI